MKTKKRLSENYWNKEIRMAAFKLREAIEARDWAMVTVILTWLETFRVP